MKVYNVITACDWFTDAAHYVELAAPFLSVSGFMIPALSVNIMQLLVFNSTTIKPMAMSHGRKTWVLDIYSLWSGHTKQGDKDFRAQHFWLFFEMTLVIQNGLLALCNLFSNCSSLLFAAGIFCTIVSSVCVCVYTLGHICLGASPHTDQ